MKCTTTREQLLTPITHLERTTGKSTTLPVLACIHIRVADGVLTLTATNLEVGLRYSMPVADPEDGVVAVPAALLTHVVSSLPSGASVTLTSDQGCLVVKGVGGTTRITLQDPEEFPTLPLVEGGVGLTVPTTVLRDALGSVVYCASTSTIKPELASVFVHPQGTTLIVTATDSFRLAERRAPLKSAVSADPFLIPARSVPDLLRVLEQVSETVTIERNDHQLSVTAPGLYMTTRLTLGTFPDYTAIIPKEFITEATVSRFDLERVLKKAAMFSDQFNQTTITVDPAQKSLSVHTENSVTGETTDSIPAQIDGDALEIRFNHRYLLDAFHTIHTDSVVLRFSGRAQPALVQPVGDTSFLYLVMPMNR